jgi:hypothetical protein
MKSFCFNMVIVLSSVFILSSCSDDSTGLKGKEYITATEMIITGKLVSREYNSAESKYDLKAWKLDTGTIVALSALNDEVGIGKVDQEGNFILTLYATLPTTVLSKYKSSESGVTAVPESFLCNSVPMKICFKIDNNSSLTTINFGVLDETNTYTIENYGFFFSSSAATISGTANSTGDIYNVSLTLGWNIRKEFKEDGFHKTYTKVSTLPDNIVWYN